MDNQLGIKGEPKSGIIARCKEEGTYLKWNSNTQFITAHNEDGTLYDQMDCSFYESWDEVKREVLAELGWIIK